MGESVVDVGKKSAAQPKAGIWELTMLGLCTYVLLALTATTFFRLSPETVASWFLAPGEGTQQDELEEIRERLANIERLLQERLK